MATTGELSEDLKSVIDRYLDGHRNRSLATLSRTSGVSYTTIRRFSQMEGNPTAEPVLKIVDAALGKDEKIAFIDRHFPEIARTIDRFQTAEYPEGGERQEMLKTFYARFPHNFILNLADLKNGSRADTIQRIYGEKGLEALDELTEEGLIDRSFEDGVAVYRRARWISVDADMALSQFRLSAELFDRSLIGTKAARVCHATASVNLKALEKIHHIVTQAITDIAGVKDDPRSSGDIPFFVDMMMNVYDKSHLERAQEQRDD